MDKTPLQQIYEKWHGLKSANEFMVWLTENESTLKAAELDAIVDAWDNSRKNKKAVFDMTGEQYYRTKYGETDH
ncbi:MAG TPA: hypothetical protein PLZ45_06835 [Ferruginibacter sp.]|nr:hypothetical protein [Ferruginibacter sp.]